MALAQQCGREAIVRQPLVISSRSITPGGVVSGGSGVGADTTE